MSIKLHPCLDRATFLNDSDKRYIERNAQALVKNGTNEIDAYHKSSNDFQKLLIDSLDDIYNQLEHGKRTGVRSAASELIQHNEGSAQEQGNQISIPKGVNEVGRGKKKASITVLDLDSELADVVRRYDEEARNPTHLKGKDIQIEQALIGTKVILGKYGDKNAITDSLAKSYLSKSKGVTIDVIAQTASQSFNNTDTAITPDDIWNFMIKFPNGVSTTRTPSGNSVLKELSDRYSAKTGKSITSRIARNLVNQLNESGRKQDDNKVNIDYFQNDRGEFDNDKILEAIDSDPELVQRVFNLDESELRNMQEEAANAKQRLKEIEKENTDQDNAWFDTLTNEQKNEIINEQEAAFRQGIESEMGSIDTGTKEESKDAIRSQQGGEGTGGQAQEVRYSVSNPTQQDTEDMIDVIKDINEENPDWDLNQIQNEVAGITEDDSADMRNFVKDAYDELQNREAAPVVKDPVLKRLNKAFLKIGTTIMDNAEQLMAKARELTGARFNIIGEEGARALDINDILNGGDDAIRTGNLKVAQEMEQQGLDYNKIFAATGWERGTDGKWRMEIEYGEFKDTKSLIKDIISLPVDEEKSVGKLRDIFDAPELFTAYPEIANLEVILENSNQPYEAQYDPNQQTIRINLRKFRGEFANRSGKEILSQTKNLRGLRRVVIHEIQHGVQTTEGFARGGNPGMFNLRELTPKDKETTIKYANDLKNGKPLKEIPEKYRDMASFINKNESLKDILFDSSLTNIEKYNKIAGEVEAENAANRSKLTKDQRKNNPISETERIKREDQIILGSSEKQSSLTPEQQEVSAQLNAARTELQSAKRAFNEKRKDLDKGLVSDTENLFGERKDQGGLFDIRASQSGRDNAMMPYKARLEKSESEVNRLQKKLDSLSSVSAQTTLFHYNQDGEILGFTHNGQIYLNGEKITAKTTMEEAGHIWINWAKQNMPDLHKSGLQKVLNSQYLKDVESNEYYRNEALKQGAKGSDEYNAYMQEEALAKAIADNGAKFITEARKKSFSEWVTAMWREVISYFGIRDLKHNIVSKLTLEQFAKMAAADVFSTNENTGKVKEDGYEKKQGKKSLLNRAFEGTNSETLRAAIKKHGLEYKPENYLSAKDDAIAFIESVGYDEALEAVRNGNINGTVKAAVWSELVDEIGRELANSTNAADIERLNKIEAELLSEWSTQSTQNGQFISALNQIYQNSEFAYKLSSQVQRYKNRNNGEISPEVEAKFEELDRQLKDAQDKKREAEARAKKAEEELAIKNIQDAIAREKASKIRAPKDRKQIIEKERKTRAQLTKDLLGSFNPSKSGGTLTAVAIPGATLVAYGAKMTASYVREGIVRVEEIAERVREEAEKFLNRNLSDEEMDKIASGIRQRLKELENIGSKIKIPRKLIYELVESGVNNMDDLVSMVREHILEDYPTATDREIRDAITGYGKVVNPSQDDVQIQIRKMTRLGRITSALEDIANKKRPLRSGLQRDKLTAEERALNRQLREALKGLPLDEEAEARQLKSSLDAIKTRLRNSIEDLQREIDTGEKSAKSRGVNYDQEAKDLAEERDRLKDIHDQIFKGPKSDAEKIEYTLHVIQRAIDKTQDRISKKDLEGKKKETITSPEIVAAREKLKAVKDILYQLQEEAGIPERKRLERAKQSAQKRLDDLEERIRTGNFSKKPKPSPLIKDAELIKIDAEIARLKEEFNKEQYKIELKNRTRLQKWIDRIIETWGLTRALRATGEFSFVLIQNWVYSIAHPIETAKAIGVSASHFANPKKHEDFINHIKAQEYYPRAKASKLAIAETDVKLTAREEMFIGSWGPLLWDNIIGYPLKVSPKLYESWKKINPLKAFERAGVGFLNTMRINRYIHGEDMLRLQGKSFQSHPQDYKNLADVINTFTGRASLGAFEQVSKPLAVIFFSPRNWASIIKQATPYAFYHFGKMTSDGKISVAQKMALSDYMKAIGGTTAVMMMIQAAIGDDDDEISIENDPRSADFMKIKIGNTRIDPWGGRQQMIVLQARLIMHAVSTFIDSSVYSFKDDKGRMMRLGEGKTSSELELIGKMAKNKLAPSTSLAFKFADRRVKRFGDHEVWVDQYGGELFPDPESNLYPIYAETIKELYKEQPEALASFLTFASFWGLNTQTYSAKEMRDKKMEFYRNEMKK